MNKTFKKVLSVVLSLAMIVTSITVYNTTAKAADEPISVNVTATKRADGQGIDANWAKPEGLTQITADNPDGDYETCGWYLNKADEEALDAAHYAKAANGWCWGTANNKEDRVGLDTVITTNDGSLNTADGGSFVIVVAYYDANGTVVAKGTSNVVELEENVNTNLNLRQDRVDEANKVLFLKWDMIKGAAKYEIINADTNEVLITKTAGDWEQFAYEEGKTYNYLMKVYNADGTEIEVENNTFTFSTEVPDNFDAALSVTYTANAAKLSWKAITGASSYVVSVDGTETTVTDTTMGVAIEANTVYHVSVKALNEAGEEITITNDAIEVQYVPEGAPAEHTNFVTEGLIWEKVGTAGEDEYYINSTHTLDKNVWYNIYSPHDSAAYHDRATACNIPDGVAAFEFKTAKDIKAMWVNSVKYENLSTALSSRNDQAEIAVNVLEKGDNVITLVYADDTMNTFAMQVKGEEAPDMSDVDITEWTAIPAKGSDSANITNTYSMNTAGYTAYVNAAIYGAYAPASATDYHGGTCNIKGAALAWAIGSAANAANAWVDGVKYEAGSEYMHVRNDSIELAESLFAEPGIHYVAVGNAKFAVKTEAPKGEETPDQTLGEVTDWVMVGTKENNNYATADGTNSYYVSEAFRNDKINHADVFGLYTDHAKSPYHQAGCTLTGAAYVSSYPSVAGTIKSVWVDGVKHTSGTTDCYIEGDQVHLAQSIFAEAKTYAVTIRATDVDLTYALKVDAAPAETTYAVTIDGAEVANVVENGTYTLPTDSTLGYLYGDTAYKAGAEVTVTSDMAFTSIGDVSVTAAEGAGIRFDNDTTGGIRFQAKVTAADAVLSSAAVKTGMLITANDIYENNGDLTVDCEYTMKNIVNSGWYNGEVGTYCGSMVNIAASNYIRKFIARAYVTITYADNTTETVYSNMTGARSIQYVASRVQAAEYAGVPEDYRATIDKFAAAK